MSEKITFCISSIPQREEMLRETIKSISPQVDSILLCLNNYNVKTAEEIKSINSQKIKYVIGDNYRGDAGKFYFAEFIEGYIATGDDDMAYPPNYIKCLKEGIEQYNRKAVVSFHGRSLQLPIKAYYSDTSQIYSFQKEVRKDVAVHVIGTGCMGYHSDTIKLKLSDFPSANLADIHFSVKAHKDGIPLIVLSHKEHWIKYFYPEETIYNSMKDNDAEHVKKLKEIEWILEKHTASI